MVAKNCAAQSPAGSILGANPDTPMKANVGSYDAAVRFTVGCLILGLGAHRESWWALAGLVPIITACAGFCPLYLPLHVNTTFTDHPRA